MHAHCLTLPGQTTDIELAAAVIPSIQLIRGKSEVLLAEGLLMRFAEKCEQAGAMRDTEYFLGKPGVLKRTPVLVLLTRETKSDWQKLSEDDLLGAVLLYEYRALGLRTAFYTSNDRSGRNSLIALPTMRRWVAQHTAKFLLGRGAQLLMFSYTGGASSEDERLVLPLAKSPDSVWAVREREVAEYLPLQKTFDETLSKIGQRTRSNLRYYRRRAKKELGCTFLASVEISESDLLAFNRECMYAVPDQLTSWRVEMLKHLESPIFMGLKDKDGRWLCLLGGRRIGKSSEIMWQMNRDGLPVYSLSLVMRSYFLEHEIARRAERFYVEGGTSHPISESFVRGIVTDFAVLRRSPLTQIARKLAQRVLSEDNELAKMLYDPNLKWTSAP